MKIWKPKENMVMKDEKKLKHKMISVEAKCWKVKWKKQWGWKKTP
jgi:hypothetical protein